MRHPPNTKTPLLVCFRVRRVSYALARMLTPPTHAEHPLWCAFVFGRFRMWSMSGVYYLHCILFG